MMQQVSQAAGLPVTRGRRLRPARLLGAAVAPLVAFAVIAIAWQLAVTVTDTPVYVFPKPTDIFDAAVERADLLGRSAWRTISAAASGLVLAMIGGVLAAILLNSARPLERALLPYAVLIQTTPIVAIAPIIVIWIGAGLRSIIVIVFIISFFPMLSNTLVGLHSVDPERLNLFRMYHASRLQRLRRLEFPTALPYILAGARISAGLSVIGAIVGEFVAGIGGGRGGLGYVITVSARQLDSAYLFAAAFVGSAVGIAFYAVVGALSRLLLGRWHESHVRDLEGGRASG
jgi:NitT/TauT family transport system permease protein